jgi:hypothetical protein
MGKARRLPSDALPVTCVIFFYGHPDVIRLVCVQQFFIRYFVRKDKSIPVPEL